MKRTQPIGIFARYLNHHDYRGEWDGYNWDAIVHLAPTNPKRWLEYCVRNDARLLYASSGAVYNHETQYAHEKRLWETECLTSGVDVVIARLFTFIGTGLKNKYAITAFLEAAQNGEPLLVWGDGSSVQ